MINIDDVISIHELLIQEYGGSHGIRDIQLLRSALERPYSGLYDTELYPTIESKAAVLLDSIVKNHAFVDGNKRIGYVVMRLFLRLNNLDISTSEDNKYAFVIKIANNQIDIDEITKWIQEHLVRI
jgi:death on curing protein